MFTMRLDLSLCGMWYCGAPVLLVGVFLQCRVLALLRAYCVMCTIYATACSIRVLVYSALLYQEFMQGNLPLSRSDQPPAPKNAAPSRRRTENKASARPQHHNPPPPPFHKLELTSSLYFMYLVLLPICVMFHSVLSDPCFDLVCQTMRM